MTATEYRISYRRIGGRKQYRIFQQRGKAIRFMADLRKGTREDLEPLIELEYDTRQCGEWTPEPVPESEPPHEDTPTTTASTPDLLHGTAMLAGERA